MKKAIIGPGGIRADTKTSISLVIIRYSAPSFCLLYLGGRLFLGRESSPDGKTPLLLTSCTILICVIRVFLSTPTKSHLVQGHLIPL